MKKKGLLSVLTTCLVFITASLSAQVVTISPTFATENDTVTITFDATEGNAALTGFVPIYAHTGVITTASATPTSWLHVQGNWGTADNKVLMAPKGNNKHEIKFHVRSFYNVPANETVLSLAFVFRNLNGSVVGRNSDGSDIFVPLFAPGQFAATLTQPSGNHIIKPLGSTLNLSGLASEPASLSLRVNNTVVATRSNATTIDTTISTQILGPGKHYITLEATKNSNTLYDSIYVVVQGPVQVQNPPQGTQYGINYLNDTSVILCLHAPFKQFVYAVGDFSDWEYDPKYMMKKNQNGDIWWIQVNGLTPQQEYRYQYWIDSTTMRVADVYAEKVLDPWNDQWIPTSVYPNLIPYPVGKTTDIVSVMKTNEQDFQWDNTINYVRPAKEKLVIYELLVRDFVHARSYQSLIDTLDYLKLLGVNAIQLMPINEFEGNESWGYNPSFFFAPDKYYGPKNKLKEFIQECHRNGMAVILDIALNHSFGQNPQVRMYFNPSAGPWGQPRPENPWFNEVERHPFNVGYDYNHESPHTRQFTKRVIGHWLQEYKIDGYRYDLSKGFTQNNSLGNVGTWNQYDQSRVNIWLDYSSHQWSVSPNSYVILEHFANNDEETALANAGMMLWGNMHGQYKQVSMGYMQNSNFNWISHQQRGWQQPNLIGYAVSHDEERLMFDNLNYGNQGPGHNIRENNIALKRIELVAALSIPIPGPKMIWQFDELGYPFSINYCPNGTINNDCRTANKPIRWDYLSVPNRVKIYKVYAAVNKLKTDYPAFSTSNFNIDGGGLAKRIFFYHSSMDVVIIGNMDVAPLSFIPGFNKTGTWYEYFTHTTHNVTDVNATVTLQPGEYRIYTTSQLPQPDLTPTINLSNEEFENQAAIRNAALRVYPNPVGKTGTSIDFHLTQRDEVLIEVVDMTGRTVKTILNESLNEGKHLIYWDGNTQSGSPARSGVYFIKLTAQSVNGMERIFKVN